MAASPERNYWIAAAVMLAIVLYGSLYPFTFEPRAGSAIATFVASVTESPSSRGDIVANIALYLPLGLFTGLALQRRFGLVAVILVATLLALAVSVAVELAQYYLPDRITSVYDTINNTVGGLVGAVIGVALEDLRLPLLRDAARDKPAALVLAAFYGYRLFPYAPTIDLHKYWRAVRAVLEDPALPPVDVARQTTMWLLICALGEALFGRRRALAVFPLLFALEVAGKVLILENRLSAPDLAGGAIAYVLWLALLGWIPGRAFIIALFVCLLVVADRLAPYQFAFAPHGFDWVPFFSLIAGSPSANLVAFLEKVFQYGGLIWLLGRCDVRLPLAAVFVAALLFATSLAETYLPGRSASVTDAAMALVIALVFGLIGGGSRRAA